MEIVSNFLASVSFLKGNVLIPNVVDSVNIIFLIVSATSVSQITFITMPGLPFFIIIFDKKHIGCAGFKKPVRYKFKEFRIHIINISTPDAELHVLFRLVVLSHQ